MFTALYLEFVAFVFGCILVRRRWPWHYRFLVGLKGFTFVVQWGGMAWSTLTQSSNHWLFNIFIPLECGSYLYLFYKTAAHPVIRRLNGWLMAMVLPLVAVSFLLVPELTIINQVMGIGCAFFLMISSCSVCIDLLLSEDEVSFFRHPLFWLAGGILFYSISNAIYFVTWEITKKMILFRFVLVEYMVAGILLNCCLMGSFFCVYLLNARKRK